MPAGLEFVSGSRGQHWTAVAIELAGKDKPMLRHALVALAAITLLSATLIPDDAFARGGRGGGGGVRGGGAAGVRGGAVGVRGGAVGVRGGGYRTAGVRGGRYGGYYGGARLGVGAAAVYRTTITMAGRRQLGWPVWRSSLKRFERARSSA